MRTNNDKNDKTAHEIFFDSLTDNVKYNINRTNGIAKVIGCMKLFWIRWSQIAYNNAANKPISTFANFRPNKKQKKTPKDVITPAIQHDIVQRFKELIIEVTVLIICNAGKGVYIYPSGI